VLRLGLLLVVFEQLFLAALVFHLQHFVFAAFAHLDDLVLAALAGEHHALFATVELLLLSVVFVVFVGLAFAAGPVVAVFLLALGRHHFQAGAVSEPAVSKEERRQLVTLQGRVAVRHQPVVTLAEQTEEGHLVPDRVHRLVRVHLDRGLVLAAHALDLDVDLVVKFDVYAVNHQVLDEVHVAKQELIALVEAHGASVGAVHVDQNLALQIFKARLVVGLHRVLILLLVWILGASLRDFIIISELFIEFAVEHLWRAGQHLFGLAVEPVENLGCAELLLGGDLLLTLGLETLAGIEFEVGGVNVLALWLVGLDLQRLGLFEILLIICAHVRNLLFNWGDPAFFFVCSRRTGHHPVLLIIHHLWRAEALGN
jgi:hypothetical protein